MQTVSVFILFASTALVTEIKLTDPFKCNRLTSSWEASTVEERKKTDWELSSLTKEWVTAAQKVAEDNFLPGGEYGPADCKMCVFVLERQKQGLNVMPPTICSQVMLKYPDRYAACKEVVKSMALMGNDVR